MSATTVKELIEILSDKDQAAIVEYIVVEPDGNLVCMKVEKQAKPIIKLLKHFG